MKFDCGETWEEKRSAAANGIHSSLLFLVEWESMIAGG